MGSNRGWCTTSLPELNDGTSGLRLRVRSEYDEMPGLCLVVDQAARLFGVNPVEVEVLLDSLVVEGYLRRTPRGFMRSRGDL